MGISQTAGDKGSIHWRRGAQESGVSINLKNCGSFRLRSLRPSAQKLRLRPTWQRADTVPVPGPCRHPPRYLFPGIRLTGTLRCIYLASSVSIKQIFLLRAILSPLWQRSSEKSFASPVRCYLESRPSRRSTPSHACPAPQL
jgi:hypothetical protein